MKFTRKQTLIMLSFIFGLFIVWRFGYKVGLVEMALYVAIIGYFVNSFRKLDH